MQDNLTKWVELVAKLNALTQDGKIKWSKQPPQQPQTLSALAALSTPQERFAAPYKDKFFCLEVFTLGIPTKPKIRLLITDQDGSSLMQIPDVVGIPDLYDSVRFNSSGVKKFIDDFLQE